MKQTNFAEQPQVDTPAPLAAVANSLTSLLNKSRAVAADEFARLQPHQAAITLGYLRAIDARGQPLVQWPKGPEHPRSALSLVAVNEADVGRQVALSFPNGAEQPLLLGLVWSADGEIAQATASTEPDVLGLGVAETMHAEIDGQAVELTAQESIVLRCGKASITLTADGQILLRGAYISSHSTGTQRIKGASVRIN